VVSPAPNAPNPFTTLWDMGYRRLVPIVPPDAVLSERSRLSKNPSARGKAVGLKGSDGAWFGFDWVRSECTESDLVRWHGMGAGVGIKTGPQADGTWLVGLDADVLDWQTAGQVTEYVKERFGEPPARVGRPPKALYVLRVDGPIPYSRVEFGENRERIEILGDGKQFVAHGLHSATGKPYQWTSRLLPFSDLPILKAGDLL
jgi:hypothetical protein